MVCRPPHKHAIVDIAPFWMMACCFAPERDGGHERPRIVKACKLEGALQPCGRAGVAPCAREVIKSAGLGDCRR